MGKNRQIGIGAVLSYVQIGIGAIITLLYTPFIIRILGQSEYGLYNTTASVISSLSILSLGFGSSYVRFFTQYNSKKDKQGIAYLNGMFLIIFLLIGAIALVCGGILSNNLTWVFDTGLTVNELELARKLVLLLTLNLAISFPASVFTSIITAHEEFVFQKLLMCVKQIASPILCIPLLLMGYGSLGMVISMVVVYLLVDIGNILFCFFKLHVQVSFRHFDWHLFREMGIYSLFIAINMIVDQINLNVGKILLGRFQGTTAVAVYSAGYTLYHYVSIFSTSVSGVFTPRIHQIWNRLGLTIEQKNQEFSRMFAKVGRIQLMILMLVVSGLTLFGKQFISIWAGAGYENAYYVVLLLSISAIVPLTQNIGIEIQRAKNMHQFRSLLYLGMALINLVSSIFLCQWYGEIGSAIGTAISFVVANGIVMNWFYLKYMKIDIRLYWKGFCRVVLATIIPFLVAIVFCHYIDSYKIHFLLAGIMLYTICYLCSLYIFVVTKEERKAIVREIKHRLHRQL